MSGIDGIGNTPVVRLDRLTGDEDAEVWVKLEAANPTGSYKDRMALAMIEAAERDGRLKPGQSVVEYSGGSTGSSLAFVCAVKGYPLRVVSSDAFASEKLRTMQAFGAEVELIPSPEGITPQLIPAMVQPGRQDRRRDRSLLDGSVQQHRHARRLPAARRRTPPAAPGPAGHHGVLQLRRHGRLLSGHDRHAAHQAADAPSRGGRAGRVGSTVRRRTPARITSRAAGSDRGLRCCGPRISTRSIAVSDADAFAMARRAARAEGIFSGPSTGANLVAALQLADHLGAGRRVVTVQVDSGIKYLNGPLYR